MVLFQLPQDLAQYVLNDWLNDTKSISALDVACSSTDELREEFLHLIRHPQFVLQPVMEPVERCADFIRWLSVRKVETDTLVVDAEHLVDVAAITFLRLPSVTTVKLKHCGDFTAKPEQLAYLLKRCPALTCFDDDCWSNPPDIDDVEILALLLAPNLPLRSLLLRECCYLQESTIRSVVFCFRLTLRELNIKNVTVSDAVLDFLALTCPNLEALQICGQDLHPAAILRYCTAVGDRLRHFDLNDFGEEVAHHAPPTDQQDDFLCQIADRLPLLETIGIGFFADTTWRSLQYVLDHCPNIVSAHAGWDFDFLVGLANSNDRACRLTMLFEPSHVVFPFITRLPFKVTELGLIECEKITEDLVAPFVAKHGPSLTSLCVASGNEVLHASSGGIIALLNGCPNARMVHLAEWHGLNQEAAAKLYPNNHLHLTSLSMIASPWLDDLVVSIILDRCPVLNRLTIDHCPLVTDITLQTVASKCGTLRTWSLTRTGVTSAGLVKLAIQLPLCPFDRISVGHLQLDPELKAVLMSMGKVGRVWMKTMGLL